MINLNDANNINFLAEVDFITKKTRFSSSVMLCSILQGSLDKNDTVVLLDADKNVITEAIISVIDYKRNSVEHIEKSDTETNDIGLEFKEISDKPIENTKFVCKINAD